MTITFVPAFYIDVYSTIDIECNEGNKKPGKFTTIIKICTNEMAQKRRGVLFF